MGPFKDGRRQLTGRESGATRDALIAWSRLVLPFALVARLAGAAEPVKAWSGAPRPFTMADLRFRQAPEDEYAESMTLSANFQGETAMDLTLAVTNLGLGDNNAGVKSSVTVEGRTVKHSEEVGDDWKQKPGQIAMGATRVEGDLGEVHVVHTAPKYAVDLVFRRKTIAWRPGSGRTTFGASGRRFYEFALIMPIAEVEGRMRLGKQWFPVKGRGYVDHSRSNLYAHEQATRWQRFRGICDGVLVQFSRFITPATYDAAPVGWLVMIDGDKILHQTHAFALALSDFRADVEVAKYKIAWRYEFRDGDRVAGFAQARERSYRTDYLAQMGALKRMIVSQFAQPIAVGLRNDWEVKLDLPGVKRVLSGRGSMSQTFIK